ncbi:iron uptake transporter permease EfeU [Psychromicrobium lacuslunae]|uniref:iron uptake transporter permease EfeU n=1 Tax=Psychromicrobium lacuslunae TaxID=1618207 RepID=UPI0009E1C19D|nr:iron uptake transporter permease EfeU [Psychromicrobium lacuslunae]
MLATLVIGLREGLEAAMIVGIIAAFLKRHGRGLGAMWLGVATALAISIGVGLTLELIAASLPQAQQEGMESIIGAIAVLMVTGMILWMSKNARSLKGDLETQAAGALSTGSTAALAVMAFLAVLREGVETSVFMLAAFQSSTDALSAGLGAVLGVLIAVAIGYGIYRGGVKLNMARFFRITGVFLVLVAAGLVLMSLRTAHEAGWLTIGQASTIDLSWLAPNGSPQSALLTGVLGIPADPRMIEVLGWSLYLIPMLLFVLWPQKLRPTAQTLPRFQRIIALSLAATAVALAALVALLPAPASTTEPLQLVAGDESIGSLSLNGDQLTLSSGSNTSSYPLPSSPSETAIHSGLSAQRFSISVPAEGQRPENLTLEQLIILNGGRLPVGVDRQRNPGPFNAGWQHQETLEVWLAAGKLIEANKQSTTELTLSGGGLPTRRTISVDNPQGNWQSTEASNNAAANSLKHAAQWRDESVLWGWWLPGVLLLGAVVFFIFSLRSLQSLRSSPQTGRTNDPTPKQQQSTQQEPQGSSSKGPVRV